MRLCQATLLRFVIVFRLAPDRLRQARGRTKRTSRDIGSDMTQFVRRTGSALLAVATVVACHGSAAFGKDPPARDSAYLAALRACQAETVDAARLACFDRAVTTLVAASDTGELRVVDREAVRETRRKLFGFSLPDFGIFGEKGDQRDEEAQPEILLTTIERVRPSDRGGWVVVTKEGAVWQLDNVPARLLSPKVGQPLEIRAGALSAYFLRINGQPGVKGRRIG